MHISCNKWSIPTKIILIALCFCVLLLIQFYLHENPLIQSAFFSSDALYLPILFQNLFEQHGHLKDWYLTPAPYFFPDYILFFPAYFFGSTTSIQMSLFAFFQVSILTILLYFFFKQWINQPKSERIGYAVLTTAILLLLAFKSPFYSYLLVSGFHYGCFLIEILCLTLVFQIIKEPQKIVPLIILGILSLLITLSDALFFTQFILPMMTSLVIIQIKTQRFSWKKTFLQIAFPLGCSLIGFFLYPRLVAHPTRYSNRPGLDHFLSNFHEISRLLSDLFHQLPFITIFLIVFYISLSFMLSLIMYKNNLLIKSQTLLISMHTFFSLIIPMTIMLLMLHFIPTSRYFIPIVSLPIIVSIGYLGSIKKLSFPLLVIGFLSLLGYSIFQTFPLPKNTSAYKKLVYPPSIACIDQALTNYPSLHNGIAEYWDAKFIQAYSQRHLIMAQYEKNLKEHHWITTHQFYQTAYDFAVIHKATNNPDFTLPLDKINRFNLPPLETIQCKDHTILIYGKNALKTRQIAHIGDEATWKGCQLPFILGNSTKHCAIRAENIKISEFVTYGPYEILPAGEYELEIIYSSSKPQQKQAGLWDMSSANSHLSGPFKKGILWGTNGKTQPIKQRVEIPTEYHLSEIEIRVKAFPGKWLQVDQLRIKRLK